MSKVVAVGTRVLFTRKEAQKTTEGGIILSSPQNEQNPLGYVCSVGPDVKIDVSVGDAISINWQAVGMMMHDEEKIYIVDAANINAVVKD